MSCCEGHSNVSYSPGAPPRRMRGKSSPVRVRNHTGRGDIGRVGDPLQGGVATSLLYSLSGNRSEIVLRAERNATRNVSQGERSMHAEV